MKKKYYIYRGKYSGTYRIASAEDAQTACALLSEGWTHTTLAEVRSLRRQECQSVTDKIAIAYIDADGKLLIVDPD